MESNTYSRVAGLIFRSGKLLLVTDSHEKFYWTPGGKKENLAETDIQTLKRELREELDIIVTDAKPYLSYQYITSEGTRSQSVAYIINKWEGKIKPQNEIAKTIWYRKDDFEKEAIPISSGAREYLYPKLIREGLLT